MSRNKKSRKVGLIGTPKSTRSQPPFNAGGKPKKKTGNAAGSRNNLESAPRQSVSKKINTDPRIGSKKPIELIAKEQTKQAEPKYYSPQQELKVLEQDTRLNKLLDKLDDGQQLTLEEQLYVDTKMARHKVLCELLGIGEREEADKTESEQDLLDKLDAIDTQRLDKN